MGMKLDPWMSGKNRSIPRNRQVAKETKSSCHLLNRFGIQVTCYSIIIIIIIIIQSSRLLHYTIQGLFEHWRPLPPAYFSLTARCPGDRRWSPILTHQRWNCSKMYCQLAQKRVCIKIYESCIGMQLAMQCDVLITKHKQSNAMPCNVMWCDVVHGCMHVRTKVRMCVRLYVQFTYGAICVCACVYL